MIIITLIIFIFVIVIIVIVNDTICTRNGLKCTCNCKCRVLSKCFLLILQLITTHLLQCLKGRGDPGPCRLSMGGRCGTQRESWLPSTGCSRQNLFSVKSFLLRRRRGPDVVGLWTDADGILSYASMIEKSLCIIFYLQFDDGETWGSVDQEVESSLSCLVDDANVTKAERDNSTSTQNPDFLLCPNPPPEIWNTEPVCGGDESTNKKLFFNAVGEDQQRQSTNRPRVVERGHFQSYPESGQLYSQGKDRWRARILKRRRKECEIEKIRRWEDVRHLRRTSRSQLMEPVHQGLDGKGERGSQATDIKTEQHVFKIKEETVASFWGSRRESYHCTVCCM